MTAQRQPNGDYVFLGQVIKLHPEVPVNKLGRYTVEGVPFVQLSLAREYVTALAKHDLQELDPLV